MLKLLYPIVRKVISVSSVKSQVTSIEDCPLRVFFKCLCLCLYLCFFVGHVMAAHHLDQMSQRSQVSRVTLWGCSLNVFVFVFVFVSQVMSPRHSDQMSQRTKVSGVANWGCSPNVFIIVLVIVFVFVFVIVFLFVRSQNLSWIQFLNCQNCSQCLKCQVSRIALLEVFSKCLCQFFLVMSCLLITLNKCLKKVTSL
mgnify:CR=1 FL=1